MKTLITKKIGSSHAKTVTREDTNHVVVLVSYTTPVAAVIGNDYYRSETYYSNTTSKQINKWLEGVKAEEKPEQFFKDLITQMENNI